MLLTEFFGRTQENRLDAENKNDPKDYSDDLYWFILDHDKLHKDYFFPIAKKIKKSFDSKDSKKDECMMELGEMVKSGCLEFYHTHKMKGKPGKIFSKNLRDMLSEKLFNHYSECIQNGKYDLDF